MKSARLLHRPKPVRLTPPSATKVRYAQMDKTSPDAEGKYLHDLALVEREINLRISWDSSSLLHLARKQRIPMNAPKRPRNPMIRDKAFASIETNSSIDLSNYSGLAEE